MSTTRRPLLVLLATLLATVTAGLAGLTPAQAAGPYVPISGAGSTWSQNALDQWRRNVDQYGMRVNFQGTGSSDGRNQFKNGTVDYAVSEIPYGLRDGNVVDAPPTRGYAYLPIVAGGTSFMYNLKIGGQKVTNIRLSGNTIARMFTGNITRWDDPLVKADNPGLVLPARKVVPVVRSDGSGTTAQFSAWLAARHADVWDPFCGKAGRPVPCGVTSNFPDGGGFVKQAGSLGVSGYVSQAQSEGAITYVEYSYALNTGFPVAKVLNDAGYYVEPTPQNVAVGLLGAKIDNNASSPTYLQQDLSGVYANKDPRTYQLSSYSYIIIPTKDEDGFNDNKGRTLGDFAYYFLCEGQQQAPALGFSPLPKNLVEAGLQQVRKIPGVDARAIDISKCNNPTFSPSGENVLAKNAPQPPACDKQGAGQCGTGTGGAKASTPTRAGAAGTGPTATGTVAGGATSSGRTRVGVGGSSGGSGGGSSGAGGAAGAVGSGVAGAPAIDPATGQAFTTTIDPATGEVVTAGGQVADGGGAVVAAVPLSLSSRGGSGMHSLLIVLCTLLLLAVTVLPPLLARRLRRGAA